MEGESRRELLSILSCMVATALLCAMIICNFYQNDNEVGYIRVAISMHKRQNEDYNSLSVSCDRLAQKSEEPTQKDSDFVQLLCPKTVTL